MLVHEIFFVPQTRHQAFAYGSSVKVEEERDEVVGSSTAYKTNGQ